VVATLLMMAAGQPSELGWNVNSRLALVFAIVDDGSFAVSRYVGDTGMFPSYDKAEWDGQVYSDKPFGVSLLCVPVYAALQVMARVLGFEWALPIKIFVLRMMSTSVPAAASIALLWLLMVRLGAPPRRALAAVVIAFFGSMWFGYSLLVMPYSPGIASCLAAIYLSVEPLRDRARPATAAAIGLLSGFALICDLLFGPLVVVAVSVAFCVGLRSAPRDRVAGLVASWAFGVAVPVTVFGAYTYSIFGTLSLPYQYEVLPLFREGMSKGLLGVTMPRLGPMWFLTLHPFRGVFFWSPWIALALAGCVMAVKRAGMHRRLGWMGLWAFAAGIVLNSGYYMWWGGFSMGARFMLPMMAVVPLGLVEICRRKRSRIWWRLLVCTGAVSIALSMPLALTDPQLPQGTSTEALLDVSLSTDLEAPQFQYLLAFYSGDWFWGPTATGRLLRALPLAAMPLAALILIRTARRLPNEDSEASLPWVRP
jgi:hypothetical protein